MTTILIVQSDAGDVANANAYVTLDEFKSYHALRGNDLTPYTDPQIEQGIIRGTDYLDTRFVYRGTKLVLDQSTEWPRQAGADVFIPWDISSPWGVSTASGSVTVNLVDANGLTIVGVPTAVKKAANEYAFRALSIALFQDAPAAEGGRQIDKETTTVDVITHSVEYAGAQGTGTFQMPAFPAADLILARAGLIVVGRQLFR